MKRAIVILIFMPITLPFVILGSLWRVADSGFFYGYRQTDILLEYLGKGKGDE